MFVLLVCTRRHLNRVDSNQDIATRDENEWNGQKTLAFLLPFFTENGSRSGIAGNEINCGIYSYTK
jgi:hypothetical protein